MNNYFWIPHIHSEVAGIGPILNPRSLSLLHERIIGIADVTDVALTTDGEKNASLSITLDAPDRMISPRPSWIRVSVAYRHRLMI